MEDCTSVAIAKDELGVEQAGKTRDGKEQRAEEIIETGSHVTAVVLAFGVVIYVAISAPLLDPTSDTQQIVLRILHLQLRSCERGRRRDSVMESLVMEMERPWIFQYVCGDSLLQTPRVAETTFSPLEKKTV